MNGKVVFHKSLARIQREELLGLGSAQESGRFLNQVCVPELFRWFLNQTIKNMLYQKVVFRQVHYRSENARGETAVLSGLVILPLDNFDRPVFRTVLGFQHGTQLERRLVPSCFNIHRPLDFVEVLIAAVFAMSGFTVVMADYPGLGIDPGEHPYVNARPLAVAVTDLLLAVKAEQNGLSGGADPRVYLIGYSEGGYATMATAREIQSNRQYAATLRVSAAAPMGGPHDLSGTMRRLMLRNDPYGADGYYMLLTLRGFRACYGDDYDGGIFTKTKALQPEYQFLFDLADGYHPLDEIHKYMPEVPRTILAPAFIAELEDTGSLLCQALRDNDLYRWMPEMPMHLYHGSADDRVPYANSRIASAGFFQRGRMIPAIPTFGLPLPGSEHLKAAPVCFMAGLAWLKQFLE